MDWKDIAGAVGKAAPIVGTLLGGPVGAAAGALVASWLGVDSTPDAVNAAISTDPQALEKIREAEISAKVQLTQLQVQQEQARLNFALQDYKQEADDRNSARELAQKQPTDHTRQIITYALLLLCTVLVVLMFTPIGRELMTDKAAIGMLGIIVGYVFNELKQVMAFWFGATRDTIAQTAAITQFATAPGTVTLTDTSKPQ